ncbi:MAG: DUF402 domain-containing protein [Tenericutes bacterium]|jgi:protein associated with RNAse G/E|nr:DUF402 domain-containing protein [Mycoplasmatota bacterium]
MKEYKIGERFIIHSYKHNQAIHRSWDEAVLLAKHDDYLIFGNNRTKVIESDGRTWKTKEPAIIYFFRDYWFNVIAQIKKDGIYFYCNIASPFIIEEGAIKYIDYDLDLRVFPDGAFKVLDRGEYNYHRIKMNYSEEIDLILNKELTNLINIVRLKKEPFNPQIIKEYYKQYKELTKKVTNV